MEVQYIYWANLCPELNIKMEPEPLLSDIAKSQSKAQGQGYINCPAIKDRHRNTFFTKIPYDLEIKFENNNIVSYDNRVEQRLGLYENSFAFNWHIPRIFFSETSQIMEVNPAFLHKTTHSKYGHAPSGAFDIGQWFRPSLPAFQLWSGETTFVAKKNEAHLYFNFPSDKKIVLKEFYFNDLLKEIMFLNINYKNIKPRQTLSAIYNMFTETKRKDIVLSEILKNLL